MFRPKKFTTTIDFRLASVFFVNLEHLSHPFLVLLFTLWKGKCWLKVCCELFVKIIQWCWHTRIIMHLRSYCKGALAIETKNKIPSLSSTVMLIQHQWLLRSSSLFFFFEMLVSPYDVISCDVINVKNFREILRYFF